MDMTREKQAPEREQALENEPGAMPVFASGELFGSASEIGIRHDGALYRLRITRQGKLILNK